MCVISLDDPLRAQITVAAGSRPSRPKAAIFAPSTSCLGKHSLKKLLDPIRMVLNAQDGVKSTCHISLCLATARVHHVAQQLYLASRVVLCYRIWPVHRPLLNIGLRCSRETMSERLPLRSLSKFRPREASRLHMQLRLKPGETKISPRHMRGMRVPTSNYPEHLF